jgi:hypothetical protein
MQELPACAFPPEIESTYDRSFGRFAAWVGGIVAVNINLSYSDNDE